MEFAIRRRTTSEATVFTAISATGRDLGYLVVVEGEGGRLDIPALRVLGHYQGQGVGTALIAAVYDHYQPDLELEWADDHLVVGGRIHTTRILEGGAREWLAHNIPKLKEAKDG